MVCPLTDICSVNEAEQIEQRDGWHKEQVQLVAQLGLGLGIELNQGVAKSWVGQSSAVRLLKLQSQSVSLVGGSMASLGDVTGAVDDLGVAGYGLVGLGRDISLLVGHGGWSRGRRECWSGWQGRNSGLVVWLAGGWLSEKERSSHDGGCDARPLCVAPFRTLMTIRHVAITLSASTSPEASPVPVRIATPWGFWGLGSWDLRA